MKKRFLADADQSLEAVLLKRQELAQAIRPYVQIYDYVVLRKGPVAYKVATHWIQKNTETNTITAQQLKIETYRRFSKSGWHWDERRSVDLTESETIRLATLPNCGTDNSVPDLGGNYLVIPLGHNAKNSILPRLLKDVSAKVTIDVITKLLAVVREDPNLITAFVSSDSFEARVSREAVAAINVARFSAAIMRLEELVQNNAKEGAFQTILSENSWMFGSEYSELLPRRNFTRDEKQDFVLRRTADGFLEIIEIKTPLGGQPLFLRDSSHSTLYPRSELSIVVAQVLHYLQEMEAHQNDIKAKDNERVSKIRAKIIIGRSGDDEQIEALRLYNGHLQGLEILTFDQLLRIAGRVVSHLEGILEPKPQTSAA